MHTHEQQNRKVTADGRNEGWGDACGSHVEFHVLIENLGSSVLRSSEQCPGLRSGDSFLCSYCSIAILQCLHPALLPGLRGDLWASWLRVRLTQSLWLGLCWASFTRWPDQKPLESRDYATTIDERPGLCLANKYFLIYSESKAKLLKVQKELIDMPCNVIINSIHFLSFLEMDLNKC